ncbi:universal stress protein [Haloarcula halophila]|uniref:universal stress protein n=1 Tax=Haloarcula TaxID=2237 RepID=UPI0023E3A6DF|nr:universal stress protein [Halomicroarcula sp. DFY41]
MGIFVPYDGSALSSAALERAHELARATDEELTIATVVPDDHRIALENGWITEDEPFAVGTIMERLRSRVAGITPTADYRIEHVGGHPTSGAIARRLRDIARDVDADLVVMGSENIASSATPADMVSGRVAARLDLDLYIVQEERADVEPIAAVSV